MVQLTAKNEMLAPVTCAGRYFFLPGLSILKQKFYWKLSLNRLK